jgi:hypothetical protein
MLNDYLPNELLKEEFVKRDYVIKTVDKDDGWLGGPLIVPFKAAGASSVAFGQLTAASDIAQDSYVRGSVDSQKEVWGSMLFNQRDLFEHGALSEQNFLKILPDTVDDFITYMKSVVSTNLLNGAWFAKATAASSANDGLIVVDHPDRFVIGQKVIVDATSDATGYVKTINMNTSTILLVTTRGGATPIDWSANNLAVGDKCYNEGAKTSAFDSIRDSLLSAANGGGTTLYGQTKTSAPYLQAINVDGSSVTAANIMSKIFEALVTVRRLGKGSPTEVLMSLTNLGYCMSVIETQKGAFNVVPGSQSASQYGWMELTVGMITKGMLKLVGIQEAEDDVIMFIDWRAIKFYSNGFFKKRKAPDGKEYFEIRETTGYQYIVDTCLFGEIIVQRPSYCGIMYGVDIPVPEGA